MTLKQRKLSQIPQRNKDLAFGYVHEKEKQNKMSVPDMIKYLCLIYLNLNKDEFDPNQSSKKIEINGNSIIRETNADKSIQNVFLKNIASSGIHKWKFKYSCDMNTFSKHDYIGVFNMDYKESMIKSDDYFFFIPKSYNFSGYAIGSKGGGVNQNGFFTKYQRYWDSGDEIEMKLDFYQQNLKFKVNGQDFGDALQIDITKKWKAAISIGGYIGHGSPKSFTLISYQKTY